MTESDSPPPPLQEAVHRLGHEVSNAVNATSVNFELLRSRLKRGGTDAAALIAVADRVSTSLERAIAGLGALRALAVAAAEVAGWPDETGKAPPDEIELIGGGDPLTFDAAAQSIAESVGVTLKPGKYGVILHVSRQERAERAE